MFGDLARTNEEAGNKDRRKNLPIKRIGDGAGNIWDSEGMERGVCG